MSAAALPFLLLASGAMQAVSSIRQGSMAQDAANENARNAEQNARLAREKSVEDERQYRNQSGKSISNIKTGYAANGISLEGSASDVLAAANSEAERDILHIQHGGDLAETSYRREAQAQRQKGSAASMGGYLSAAGSLLGAGAQYGMYSGYGKSKFPGGGDSDWVDYDDYIN